MSGVFRVETVDGIQRIELDLPGSSANKLSTPVMLELSQLIDELKIKAETGDVRAAYFISRKPKIFIAGADIDEIRAFKNKEEFARAIDKAHSIFNAIEDLPIPVIAAIHGACMGGGCELSLACDYRLATSAKETRIGLPEVQLGILPGFGGCYRMPKLIGLQASLDIILAGKDVDSRKAKKIGLVDKVVHPGILDAQAHKMALEMAGQKNPKQFRAKTVMNRFLETPLGRPMVFRKARQTVLGATGGHYPAPIKALEVIQATYGRSRSQSLEIEKQAFCEVAVTDVSKHLIDIFYMREAAKKGSGVSSSVTKFTNRRIGVLGAGTMGGGIAYVAADKGLDVRLKDISHQAIAIGLKHAQDLFDKKRKRRRLNDYEFKQRMSLISGSLEYKGFSHADVVIEAVVEDVEIKKKVIAEVAGLMNPNAILATNTSTLSVTELAKSHPYPKNFAGMHFFNPVHLMPLVEVIRGEETSDEAVARVYALAKQMGKVPVVVKDRPAFVVNRILIPYLIEAFFFLREGCSVEFVDQVFKKDFGMPMGPFALMDEVGLDIADKVTRIFHQSLGERIELPEGIDLLSKNGRLGKKNKKGFYLYDSQGKRRAVDQTIYSELKLSSPTDKFKGDELIRRALFRMIDEAAIALISEKVVEGPAVLDLAMIFGTGFPPFRGGLLKYADQTGLSRIVEDLDVFAAQYGVRYRPSEVLANLAKDNGQFYAQSSETPRSSKPSQTSALSPV